MLHHSLSVFKTGFYATGNKSTMNKIKKKKLQNLEPYALRSLNPSK
jgi:hypothetical protein